ncbi:MAG: hypothetical protein RMI43_03775 [Candidatus Caldarchaeum sp.]|nr:hypothetical protein [Candidatus Caldarchaeum sp.]
MAWKVLVFRQGLGWDEISKVISHTGVVETFEQALDLGATAVIRNLEKTVKPAGSSFGDPVGFRVTSSDASPQPLPLNTVNWQEVRHRFFRRGDSFLLYKTWSWPD